MTKQALLIISFLTLLACENQSGQTAIANLFQKNLSEPGGKQICTRIATPENFNRLQPDSNSFGYYLQHFPLKEINAKVYHYDGTEKRNSNVYEAVLDIDIGNKDLQQCADAVMRLRAEYLYSKKLYHTIHFNFTNGFKADYSKWAEGYRIKVNENNVSWYKAAEKSYSYETFKQYLEIVFSYAGTLSLSKELKNVSVDEINIGDVFIWGGSPGHAVIVMDVAEKPTNKKRIFLIAQSYMPAQNIHVLKNLNDSNLSPWYDLSETDKLYSPEWTFEKSDLKRFTD